MTSQKKAVVPQYIDTWIQGAEYNGFDLYEAMTDETPDKVSTWIVCNPETFAKAWIYGYEIEKEKLYTAKNKITNSYLGKNGGWSHYGRACSPEIIKHSKSTWRSLGVWDNDLYEITEVKDD